MNFSFASPHFLLLLLLLPCFFLCKRETKRFYFPKLEWIGRETQLFNVELWLKMALFTLMVFSLAQPFLYEAHAANDKKGRDLILAIDASGSMAQSGFDEKEPFKTRFETAISLAKDFTKKRFDDNMGVVIFGTFAYSASPLTYDLSALNYLLDMTDVGIAGESTAIGDAMMQSLRTLEPGNAKKKVIVLLTDGHHNSGTTSPKQAVEKAKKKGVRIYTVGIGKKSGYDAALLETIAKESGAKSYAATNAKALKEVYGEINELEPSPIRSEQYLNRKELYVYALALAIALLFGWVLWRRKETA